MTTTRRLLAVSSAAAVFAVCGSALSGRWPELDVYASGEFARGYQYGRARLTDRIDID